MILDGCVLPCQWLIGLAIQFPRFTHSSPDLNSSSIPSIYQPLVQIYRVERWCCGHRMTHIVRAQWNQSMWDSYIVSCGK